MAFLAVLLMLPRGHVAFADNIPNISAESAIIINELGETLFAKNAEERMLIASTTKLMTALVAVENLNVGDTVEIPSACCGVEGSSMYLKPGEQYTVRELLLGLMLVSGNDAAEALAYKVSGSETAFVVLMNRKAAELDMKSSHFENPHGLDAKNHYSTASDLAKLMLACVENETLREIIGIKTARIKEQDLVNHNRLLWKYDGCICGKTGYTMAAGRCLATCSERNGTQFICVTLKAPDDWNDHTKLYDWAFANYEMRNLTEGLIYDIPVVSGNRQRVHIKPKREIRVFVNNEQEIKIVAEFPKFVFAPVNLGETAGSLCVIIDEKNIDSCDLVYAENAEAAFKTSAVGAFGELN